MDDRGFSLVELIVALVVVGIASAALMMAVGQAAISGAKPLMYAQARAVATAYVEEVTVQAFADPDGVETGGDEGEARGAFDDVWDYNAINGESPMGVNGQPLGVDGSPVGAGLSVSVSVSGDTDTQAGFADVAVRVRGEGIDYRIRTRRRP